MGGGSISLCSRFLAGTRTYSIGNAPAVPRAGMPPLEAPGTERICPSREGGCDPSQGRTSLRLSLCPWVRTRKGTEVQSRLARNNLLWPPAGKLESDREGPCPGQRLCYLLLRSQEGRKRYTELEGEVPPSHFSSARPWPP